MMSTPTYFRFTDTDGQPRFVIQLTDPAKIEHARKILRGEENDKIHLYGTIIRRPAAYNPGWGFHMDPATINFFIAAIEVCDASMRYVEEHLDEAGGAFLPGAIWCPWTSRLVDEFTPPTT